MVVDSPLGGSWPLKSFYFTQLSGAQLSVAASPLSSTTHEGCETVTLLNILSHGYGIVENSWCKIYEVYLFMLKVKY